MVLLFYLHCKFANTAWQICCELMSYEQCNFVFSNGASHYLLHVGQVWSQRRSAQEIVLDKIRAISCNFMTRHSCWNLVQLFWSELDKRPANVLLEVDNLSCTWDVKKKTWDRQWLTNYRTCLSSSRVNQDCQILTKKLSESVEEDGVMTLDPALFQLACAMCQWKQQGTVKLLKKISNIAYG